MTKIDSFFQNFICENQVEKIQKKKDLLFLRNFHEKLFKEILSLNSSKLKFEHFLTLNQFYYKETSEQKLQGFYFLKKDKI